MKGDLSHYYSTPFPAAWKQQASLGTSELIPLPARSSLSTAKPCSPAGYPVLDVTHTSGPLQSLFPLFFFCQDVPSQQ